MLCDIAKTDGGMNPALNLRNRAFLPDTRVLHTHIPMHPAGFEPAPNRLRAGDSALSYECADHKHVHCIRSIYNYSAAQSRANHKIHEPAWARTTDFLFVGEALYQLSYRPIFPVFYERFTFDREELPADGGRELYADQHDLIRSA